VNPSTTLNYVLSRLRQNYVPVELVNDEDVLVLINDAYQEACERSLCLRAYHEIPLLDDQASYPLPVDFSQMLWVFANGSELQPQPFHQMTNQPAHGYTILGHEITINPVVDPTPGLAAIVYAATPTRFTTYDSDLDERFPIEFSDVLVHHVRWRINMMAGGAEKIQLAEIDKGLFDQRVTMLRRTTDVVERVGPPVVSTVADRRGWQVSW
jgi:hypothetical protein